MSADEFWKDDPQLFVSYRISFINKKQREVEEEDYKSWLRGFYVNDGNSRLLSSLKQFINNILAGFSNKTKDNTKIDLYPKKPYSQINKETETKKEMEEKEKEKRYKDYEQSLIYYGTLKKQYLERLKNKKGE